MEVETFFKTIFQRDVLVVKSNKVTRSLYERLNFGSERIFEWIRRSELTYEKDLTVTRVNKDGIRENFHESESGAAKHDKGVAKQFKEKGCSLRLLCPQAHSPSVHRVLSELELEFEDFVSSNAYLTPGNTQGFAAHVSETRLDLDYRTWTRCEHPQAWKSNLERLLVSSQQRSRSRFATLLLE